MSDTQVALIGAADGLASAAVNRNQLIHAVNALPYNQQAEAMAELVALIAAAGVAEGVLRTMATVLEPAEPAPTVRVSVAPRDDRGRFTVHMHDGKPLHPAMHL